jgi:hypothetical protein
MGRRGGKAEKITGAERKTMKKMLRGKRRGNDNWDQENPRIKKKRKSKTDRPRESIRLLLCL